MVPAFEKLSLAGNTDTEQVISGVSVMQEKFRSFWETAIYNVWYPRRFSGNESACNVVDLGLIPGSGRSPGEGNGKPLQYSCLGNPMDRGAWWATVHGVAKSQTRRSTRSIHISTTSRPEAWRTHPPEGLIRLETFFPAFKNGFAL